MPRGIGARTDNYAADVTYLSRMRQAVAKDMEIPEPKRLSLDEKLTVLIQDLLSAHMPVKNGKTKK